MINFFFFLEAKAIFQRTNLCSLIHTPKLHQKRKPHLTKYIIHPNPTPFTGLSSLPWRGFKIGEETEEKWQIHHFIKNPQETEVST